VARQLKTAKRQRKGSSTSNKSKTPSIGEKRKLGRITENLAEYFWTNVTSFMTQKGKTGKRLRMRFGQLNSGRRSESPSN